MDCERHQKHLVPGNSISRAVFEAGQSSVRRQILSLPVPSCLPAYSGPLRRPFGHMQKARTGLYGAACR